MFDYFYILLYFLTHLINFKIFEVSKVYFLEKIMVLSHFRASSMNMKSYEIPFLQDE